MDTRSTQRIPFERFDGRVPITAPVLGPVGVGALAMATMLGIEPLGFRKDGSPIWPMAGGAPYSAVLGDQIKVLKEESTEILAEAEKAGDMAPYRERLDQIDARIPELEADLKRALRVAEHDRQAPAAADDVEGPVTPLGAWHSPIVPVSQQYIESSEWKEYLARVAPHGFSDGKGAKTRVDGPKIDIKGSILPGRRGPQALVASGVTSAGSLIIPDQTGIFDESTFQRPLSIMDVITRATTDSNTVEYVKVTGFTNNAAFVPEADNVLATDDTGRKPWSALTLVRVIESVRTLAHGEAATKNALSDAGQMRAIIDQFLRYGLLETLEDEIVQGTGGEGFVGILETPDIQSQAFDTDILTTARKAKTKVRTVGRARANAYGFHPNDWERFDLEMTLGGPGSNYRQAGIQTEPSLWGLPVFESEGIPEGTGIVADFRRAVFWDRQQTTVEATSGYMDFFMKNLVAILAELRGAFGVIRPEAFVEIDLGAS